MLYCFNTYTNGFKKSNLLILFLFFEITDYALALSIKNELVIKSRGTWLMTCENYCLFNLKKGNVTTWPKSGCVVDRGNFWQGGCCVDNEGT